MKIKFKIFQYVLVLTMLAGPSCDVVEIDPTHILDGSNAFRNLDDVDQHLTGVYSYFRSGNYYGSSYGVLADLSTDNLAETSESLGNLRTIVDWRYVSNDATVAGAWQLPYSVIKDANLVLGNVERFEDSGSGQKARIKGQALAIRALAHFDLLRYFGQSYERNSDALGIPIVTSSGVATPGRNTVEQVYNQIYADLNEARILLNEDLDEDINSDSDRSLIDKIVVDAIRARVALYAGDFQTAIDAATEIIDNSGLSLATRDAFPDIWSDDDLANEVIWSIAFLPGQGQPGANVFFSVNNRLEFRPSLDMLSLFDADNDIRYEAYFSENVNLPGRTGQIVPIKYLGRNGSTDGNVNYKAFRVGEMYLIRAEAYAESNQDALALADLNDLRAARIEGYVDEILSGQQLRDAIALERRVELFMEGHRWFDLRRSGASITRGADCAAPATQCSLPASSFRWIWPIPQAELNGNPVIRTQQNQGYN